LLPKLSRIFKIKSRYAKSRRIYPDGRTRGGHTQKRVARDKAKAAETRPKPRFRGHMDESEYLLSWRSCTGTLLLPSPINTPAEQQRGRIQRRELRVFFSFSLFKFLVIFVSLLAYFGGGEEHCIWKLHSNKGYLFFFVI